MSETIFGYPVIWVDREDFPIIEKVQLGDWSSYMAKIKLFTWQEFKEEIDRQLKEQGISQDTEIWFIDISYPDRKENGKAPFGASFQEKQGICIC